MIEVKVNDMALYDTVPNIRIAFSVPRSEALNDLYALKDKSLDGYVLRLVKAKKRSLNANAYMWQLCTKIAEKIRATKEDVYKKAIREVGWYMDMSVEAGKEEEAKSLWSMRGVGWFAEDIFCSRKFSEIRFYKGSSVYNGEEMRRLIDYIVDGATELGIETMTPMEIERLNQLWEGEVN